MLALECTLLTIALPLLVAYFSLEKYLFAILWLITLYGFILFKRAGISPFWQWNRAALTRANLRPILVRWLICLPLLLTFTYLHDRTRLFSFMLERPQIWAMVMLLYPLLSALPQEFIFRRFFFARYQPLFPRGTVLLATSALTFGFAHIVMQNWVAVILSIFGGWFFATTYQRSKSLALVTLEHALYGNTLFTIGLGWYFYHGAAHAH